MNQEKIIMGAPPDKEQKSKKGLLIFVISVVLLIIIGVIFFKDRFMPSSTQQTEKHAKTPQLGEEQQPSVSEKLVIAQQPATEETEHESLASVGGKQPSISQEPTIVKLSETEKPSSEISIAQPSEKKIEFPPPAEEPLPVVSEKPEALQLAETQKAQVAKEKTKAFHAIPVRKSQASVWVVKKGDSLWKISCNPQIVGDPFKWHLIYDANKNQIKDPNLIYPGQELIIPKN